jgi:hypothetical protein
MDYLERTARENDERRCRLMLWEGSSAQNITKRMRVYHQARPRWTEPGGHSALEACHHQGRARARGGRRGGGGGQGAAGRSGGGGATIRKRKTATKHCSENATELPCAPSASAFSELAKAGTYQRRRTSATLQKKKRLILIAGAGREESSAQNITKRMRVYPQAHPRRTEPGGALGIRGMSSSRPSEACGAS